MNGDFVAMHFVAPEAFYLDGDVVAGVAAGSLFLKKARPK